MLSIDTFAKTIGVLAILLSGFISWSDQQADIPEVTSSYSIQRVKPSPPFPARLELEGQPKAGEIVQLLLEVENQFQPGTLRVRFVVPKPLRTGDFEKRMTQSAQVDRAGKTRMNVPIRIPEGGRHVLEALISMTTAEGAEVSSSAVLVLGEQDDVPSKASELILTRPDGTELRVFRDVQPVESQEDER